METKNDYFGIISSVSKLNFHHYENGWRLSYKDIEFKNLDSNGQVITFQIRVFSQDTYNTMRKQQIIFVQQSEIYSQWQSVIRLKTIKYVTKIFVGKDNVKDNITSNEYKQIQSFLDLNKSQMGFEQRKIRKKQKKIKKQ